MRGSRWCGVAHAVRWISSAPATFLLRRPGASLSCFAGDGLWALDIEHHRGTEMIETHSSEAIWELTYFGHARS